MYQRWRGDIRKDASRLPWGFFVGTVRTINFAPPIMNAVLNVRSYQNIQPEQKAFMIEAGPQGTLTALSGTVRQSGTLQRTVP
jgi:hypothetical protein